MKDEEIPFICLECTYVNTCSRTQIHRCYEDEEKEIEQARKANEKNRGLDAMDFKNGVTNEATSRKRKKLLHSAAHTPESATSKDEVREDDYANNK